MKGQFLSIQWITNRPHSIFVMPLYLHSEQCHWVTEFLHSGSVCNLLPLRVTITILTWRRFYCPMYAWGTLALCMHEVHSPYAGSEDSIHEQCPISILIISSHLVECNTICGHGNALNILHTESDLQVLLSTKMSSHGNSLHTNTYTPMQTQIHKPFSN